MLNFEAQMDAAVEAEMALQRVPSFSVAIVREGRHLYARAYGDARLEPPVAATTTTAYNIASVSKQFACVAILMLSQQGKLGIDDSVAKYFPRVTRAKELTLRELMANVSGIPDHYPLGFADPDKFRDTTPDEVIERWGSMPLEFDPGTQWTYSNVNWYLLGKIIERTSGMPFEEFLHRRIFEPLDMRDTLYNDPPTFPNGKAFNYTAYCLGPTRRAIPERANWMYAAGAIASTPTDLAKWDRALFEGRLLDDRSFDMMTASYVLKNGKKAGYGFGWFVERRGPHTVVYHDGQIAGFTSHNAIVPRERVAVSVLTNSDAARPNVLAAQLLRLILPKAVQQKLKTRVRHADVTNVKKVIDAFRSGKLDDAMLTAEFRFFLTPERREDARTGLNEFGTIASAAREGGGTRGSMSWSAIALSNAEGRRARALIRHTDDGKLAEFNVFPAGGA